MTEKQVRAYTDGACKGNPGPGGYGVRIRYPDGRVKEYGGDEAPSTNNRMELMAVIEALRRAHDVEDLLVVTDSEYVRQGITKWLKGWKARGWITKNNTPVLNQDLWKTLDGLLRPGVTFAYTAGHAGDPDNERCDRIASSYAQGTPVQLEDGVDHTPFAPFAEKPNPSSSKASGKGTGPVVYLSLVAGVLKKHKTWAECEIEVKGRSGALFKKCRGPEEEVAILEKWGV